MTFIIIILCLVAERMLLEQEEYRQPNWFRRYANWSQQLPWGEFISQSISGILLILAPLLIIVLLLQGLFDDALGGVLELLFACIVLYMCLGPRDLHHQVENFIDAWESGDSDRAQRAGGEFAKEKAGQSETEYAGEISMGILHQGFIRTFSVIFWFVILGPVGAVLYRSTRTLKNILPGMEDMGNEFRSGVERLLEILDWLPARLTAFTYALSGNFHDATHEWWNHTDPDDQAPTQILDRAGRGALGLNILFEDEDDPNPAVLAELALAMVLRTTTIWVGVLALITITSWVS